MLISPAYAQAAGAPGGGDMLMSFLPLILIFVVFYFLLIRPQQRKAKTHREMIQNLKRGDQVITSGGILGKVTRVDANDIMLTVEIAKDVQVKVARSTISEKFDRATTTTNDNRAAQQPAASAGDGGGGGGGGFMSRILGKK